jgi:hypothetical protein
MSPREYFCPRFREPGKFSFLAKRVSRGLDRLGFLYGWLSCKIKRVEGGLQHQYDIVI